MSYIEVKDCKKPPAGVWGRNLEATTVFVVSVNPNARADLVTASIVMGQDSSPNPRWGLFA